MGEPHVDRDMPSRLIKWYGGYGPSLVLGQCPHDGCCHDAQAAIAWGPSMERYELIKCDVASGCYGGCRAWVNGQGRVTSAWLQVEATERVLNRLPTS